MTKSNLKLARPPEFLLCVVVLKFQNSRCIQTYCGTLTLCVSHAASKEVMEEEWLFGDYGDDESS